MIRFARLAAVSGNEWRLVRKVLPQVAMLLLVIPLVMMVLISDGLGTIARQAAPDQDAAGADFAVPGMSLMFGFMLIGFLGAGFIEEHSWGTWERLRASSARPAEILVGKVVPYAGLAVAQIIVLFGVGWAFLGLHLRGSVLALVLMVLAVVLLLISLALAVTAFCSTSQQVSAAANLVGIVLGLVGGVLLPAAVLPGWVQYISPVTPQYWALRGFQKVLVGRGSVADVGVELLVLVSASVVLFAIAARRFRFDESKRSQA